MRDEMETYLQQYLPIIKYLGVDKNDLISCLVEKMGNRMIELLPKLNTHLINEILLELSELVKQQPQLCDLLVLVSDSQKSFEDSFVDACFASNDLFLKLSMNTRRILWKSRPSQFGDNLLPYVKRYVTWLTDKYINIDGLYDTEGNKDDLNSISFLNLCYNERRQHQSTIDTLNLIGDSFPLYDLSLQFIRTLWLKTKQINYCSLRLDLLLVNNSVTSIQNIRSADPCYKLVWYLDSCITKNHLKKKYLIEIHNIIKTASKNEDFVLGDIGMILSDPSVRSFLLMSMVKRLEKDFIQRIIPRDCNYLSMVITLLKNSFSCVDNLSSTSSTSHENIQTKIQVTDRIIFTQLLPILMYQLGFQHSLANQVKCESLPSLSDFLCNNSSHYTPIFDALFSCEMSSYMWWYAQVFLLEKFENWEMFMWMVNEYVKNLSQYCFLQIEYEDQLEGTNNADLNKSNETHHTVRFFSEFILLMIVPIFVKYAKSKIDDQLDWYNFFEIFFVKIPNILNHNEYVHSANNILKIGIKMLSIIGPYIHESVFNEISDMIAMFAEELKF